MPRSRPACSGRSPSPTSGHRVWFTTRWPVYPDERAGARPQSLPNRHKSARGPWPPPDEPEVLVEVRLHARLLASGEQFFDRRLLGPDELSEEAALGEDLVGQDRA